MSVHGSDIGAAGERPATWQDDGRRFEHDRHDADDDAIDLIELLRPVARRWKTLVGTALAAGAIGWGASFLVEPSFTSTTTLLPPQQPQSAAASALASLGALAGLAGGSGAVKNPADLYIGLMQSVNVSDRIIQDFHLMEVYKSRYRIDARKTLAHQVSISTGKRDGMINIAVEDHDPVRAAAIANRYVEELRRLTSGLAVSEAQQRRMFFEKLMQETKGRLAEAQGALQDAGFTGAAIKAEPQAAATAYAHLRAELTTEEVKLATLRSSMTETAPQVTRQRSTVQALRSQLARMEKSEQPDGSSPDYVGKYREFKYQETLFDLLAKQYEIARVDESREGAVIQVVDVATPPEVKSSPRRAVYALIGAALGGLIAAAALGLGGRQRGTGRAGPAAAVA